MLVERRGQAALEFLLTYGWAILAVLVVIAALAYFGVLSPASLLPEKCSMPQMLGCVDHVVGSDGVEVKLQNGAGRDLIIREVTFVSDAVAGSCSTGQIIGLLRNGEVKGFSAVDPAACGFVGSGRSKNRYRIEVKYSWLDSPAIDHSLEGELLSRVEKDAVIGSFDGSEEGYSGSSSGLISYWQLDGNAEDSAGTHNGVSYASGFNHLGDSSFEDAQPLASGSGWVGQYGSGSWEWVANEFYHGSHSVRFFVPSGLPSNQYKFIVSAFFPIQASTQYTFSTYCKGQSATPKGCIVKVDWYRADKSHILHQWVFDKDIGTSWKRQSGSLASPSDAAFMKVTVGIHSSDWGPNPDYPAPDTSVWFDAVQVEKGSTATTYYVDEWVSGHSGQAAAFDGVDDYVIVSDSSSLHLGDLTIGFWYNIGGQPSGGVGSYRNLVMKSNDWWAADTWGVHNIDINRGNIYFMTRVGGGTAKTLSYNTGLTSGWIHIVATKSGTSGKLYINSIERASGTLDATTTSATESLYIGGGTDRVNTGLIDEVMIYDRVLSESEIRALAG